MFIIIHKIYILLYHIMSKKSRDLRQLQRFFDFLSNFILLYILAIYAHRAVRTLMFLVEICFVTCYKLVFTLLTMLVKWCIIKPVTTVEI